MAKTSAYKIFGIFVMFSVFASLTFSQSDKTAKRKLLFAEVKEAEQRIAICLKKQREAQIREFGRVMPRVSGHCWDGCPTRLVKPYYPVEARRYRVSGVVNVETIVDENGKVIYARMIKGSSFFKRASEMAAKASEYPPKNDCDHKPIKFRWIISYRFAPAN